MDTKTSDMGTQSSSMDRSMERRTGVNLSESPAEHAEQDSQSTQLRNMGARPSADTMREFRNHMDPAVTHMGPSTRYEPSALERSVVANNRPDSRRIEDGGEHL